MKDELIKLLRRAEKDKPYPDELAEEIMYLIAPEFEKAEKYDALCLIKDPIQVEREYFQELVEKAEKWDRVKSYIAGECTLCPACTALTEKEPT